MMFGHCFNISHYRAKDTRISSLHRNRLNHAKNNSLPGRRLVDDLTLICHFLLQICSFLSIFLAVNTVVEPI